MADVATPSAVAMATSDASAKKADKNQAAKPEKPDEAKFKSDLEAADKEFAAAQKKFDDIKAKYDAGKSGDKNPSAPRQKELRDRLGQIRETQKGHKNSRQTVLDKIKKLDDQLKSRIDENKSARSKVAFKSVDEIDREIERLEKQVNTGTMKLVDEKKALADVSALRKQRKGFAGFDQAQKHIDEVKAQIAELKKQMDNPESKALSDEYNAITTELDAIRAEQDAAFKNRSSLKADLDKAHAERETKRDAKKKIMDEYHTARRAHREHEQQAYKARRERQQAERQAYEQGKRKAVAAAKLEEASAPAYQDEIMTAQGLIRYFDPSSVEAKEATGPGKYAAAAQRVIDASGIKGTPLSRKGEDEEAYFIGGGGKKKKGKKGGNQSGTATPASEGKFNLSLDIIEGLAKINVEPPMNQSEVSITVTKVKERLDFWKKDQDRKTKENIAKAQKEIDRLEAESSAGGESKDAQAEASRPPTEGSANKPAAKLEGVNGTPDGDAELSQEKEADIDVAEELKKAKIEDSEQPSEA